MGTLRIKRGTKTQLQTTPGYTPAEGELVYTTDSKEVFVGDGTTVGGTPVSVSTQNLEDLGNVQALSAQQDQILVYNGSNWAATDNPALDVRGNIFSDDSSLLVDAINGQIVGPINTSSVVSSGAIIGDLTGDVTGSVTGNLVGDTTGTHFGNVDGNVDGDLNGSVFADDSTLLVDAIDGTIVGPVVTTTTTISSALSQLKMNYNLAGSVNSTILGDIRFQDQDTDKGYIQGRKNTIYISAEDSAVTGLTIYAGHTVMGGNNLRIDPNNSDFTVPTDALEVVGDASVTNITASADVEGKTITMTGGADSFIQFGSLTTTQRDALTAVNGMVIYNSSTNKFQGYENGAWVNLV